MNVAVTGARGRVAPLLIRALRERGHTVTPYSRKAGAGTRSLDSFCGEEECVVHCAWSRLPLEAESDPLHCEREDLPLLQHILDLTNPSKARVFFLSSGAVYGDTGQEPADETCRPRPLGVYARSKCAAESLLAECAGERSVILRTTNLLFSANPGTNRSQGVLPRLMEAALSGQPIQLWGDGLATKDYIHEDDFLTAFEALMDSQAIGVFNVGSGHSLSLREIIDSVEYIIGCQVPVVHRPHFPWDVTHSRISINKLCHATGWAPTMSAAQAVARAIRELQ